MEKDSARASPRAGVYVARASPRAGVCNLLMVKGFVGIAIAIVGL
ncbi:hypothetical protein COLO4_35849 [Corchorus olitorius]|uniref:Uncharacterized protein n=1 Tax=Corchorus olitorius TaxID=93759 RepID=A0A1R3GCM7_9ROSI|nr:hypothetical protein COLO4_35849 [Corchorus olitorius]